MDNWLLYSVIVAAIGCGWWLGRRERQKRQAAPGPHFYAGLNYLLNEEPDRAVTRFIADLDVNQHTLETHLALGSLLRKRGDLEKAVVVHENILANAEFDQDIRASVQLELARDYLLAGLLDRAEALLLALLEQPGTARRESLELMIEIYEREKDWPKAIAVGEQLAAFDASAKYEQAISHYYCEIAQASMKGQDVEAARSALREGIGHDAKNPRTSLLLAQLELQQQHYPQAVRALQRIKDQDPRFVPESLELLAQAVAGGGATQEALQAYLRDCLAVTPAISIVLFLANSIRQEQGDHAMGKFIADYLKVKPTIRGLSQLIELHMENTSGAARENLSILRSFTTALVADKPAYRCHDCGFEGRKLHWHCPVCKSWGRIQAIFGLEGE